MKINRMMTNVCTTDLQACKHFYHTLFDFNVDFDSDWFIHLISDDRQLELGIIRRDSEVVPQAFQQTPQGMYLTFVVESVEDAYSLAQQEGFKILQAPHDTAYGQKRLLLQDPEGVLVDISSPMA